MKGVIILESKIWARALVADHSSLQHHTIAHEGITTYEEASAEVFSWRKSAWVDPREETESSTPHDARVELKLIIVYDSKCIRILELKLDDNGALSASIVRYVVRYKLGLRLYSEEVNHAFDHHSRARQVRRSWGNTRSLSGVEQFSNVESVLLECVIEEN